MAASAVWRRCSDRRPAVLHALLPAVASPQLNPASRRPKHHQCLQSEVHELKLCAVILNQTLLRILLSILMLELSLLLSLTLVPSILLQFAV